MLTTIWEIYWRRGVEQEKKNIKQKSHYLIYCCLLSETCTALGRRKNSETGKDGHKQCVLHRTDNRTYS